MALLIVPAAAAYELGDTVSDFSLRDVNGSSAALYDYLGDIVVLNFFATWCPGCNDEAAELENSIWQAYRDHGVTVLAVDIQEPAPLVQGWAAALGVTYPILLAPDWELFTRFPNAQSIPYNAVLDRRMVMRYGVSGFEGPAIIAIVEQILAEDEVATEAVGWGAVKAMYR